MAKEKAEKPAKKEPKGKSRFVYLIGDEGAILVLIQAGVVLRRLFAPTVDPQNTRAFVELLREFPAAPVYVLLDLLDQSYVRHTMPPVSSLGLGKIVQRRLDRDFAKDDLKGSINLGRETKGRKDWNLLLISVAMTAELRAWVDLVLELPNRFVGIYLVPVESTALIERLSNAIGKDPRTQPADEKVSRKRVRKNPLAPKQKTDQTEASRWQMLVSHNKVGGYRQVVLKNGQLVFTRLTQGVSGSPELMAGTVEQDIFNTIEYLRRLSLNDEAIELFLIVGQDIQNHIARERFGRHKVHLLTPFQAAELLELKQAVLSADRFGDVVIASAFGIDRKHRLKLMPEHVLQFDRLHTIDRGVRVAAAAIVFGLLGYAFYNVALLPGALSELDESSATEKTRLAKVAEYQTSIAGLQVDPQQVNDLVTLDEMLTAERPRFLGLIETLSNVLDDRNLAKSIGWTYDYPAGTAFLPKNATAPNPAPVDPAKPEANLPLKIEITLDLTYSNAQTWEDFIRDKEAFFESLTKSFGGYYVRHTSLPGQNDATGSLSVNFDDIEQRQKAESNQTFPVTLTLSGPKPEPVTAPKP